MPSRTKPWASATSTMQASRLCIPARPTAYGVWRASIQMYTMEPGRRPCLRRIEELFYASTHQGYGMYPGTGYESETGVADNVVNVPFKEGAGSTEFRKAYDDKILPKLAAFRPELIIISTGFDAHEEDPLGGLELTDDDFYWLAKRLQDVGRECDAPVISLLEGGYDLRAIADCAVAHMRGLMESPATRRRPPTATIETVAPAEGGTAALVTVVEAAVEVIEGRGGLEEVVHGMRVLEIGHDEGVVQNGSGLSDNESRAKD